jgi:hypothetical protein
VDNAFKAALKTTGLWEFFEEYRDELIAKGMERSEAVTKSIQHYNPLVVEQQSRKEESSGGGDSDSNCCPGQGHPTVPSHEDGFGLKDDFMAKEAGIVEIITWVAKQLELSPAEVDQEQAPCPEALGMYKSYSRSEERKDEFWDKIFIKLIPSRAQIEGHATVDMDGVSIVKTIDRLQAIKKDAEKS